MKRLTLTVTILAAILMGLSAQTFEFYADKYLGTYVKEKKVTVKSDYGTMVIKFDKVGDVVYRVTLPLPNGSNAAIMMEDSVDYHFRRTGSRWSDFYYEIPYNFVQKVKVADNYDKIVEYYDLHKDDRVKVYKHTKKDKWVCIVMDKKYANSDKWIKLH